MSKIVTLRLYKGRKMYDENGNVASNNDVVKIPHGTKEWKNLTANGRAFGYTSAEVLKVVETHSKDLENAYKQRDKLLRNPNHSTKEADEWTARIEELRAKEYPELKKEPFQEEVDKCFAAEEETQAKSTNDEAAKLRAELAELKKMIQAGNKLENKALEKDAEPLKEEEPKTNADEEALKARYEELYGKKPHHKLKPENIQQAIEEKEAELND